MTSTPRKTRASAPTEVVITVDPTPATEEVINDASSEKSETHDAEVQLVEPEPPLIPVEPVFACRDRRTEWDRKKEFLEKMITAFDQERLPDTGTKELTRFLQDMTVPRKAISELIPEEFKILREGEMKKIILRIQTLSSKAIDS